jgi:hypothetical protein
MLLLILAGATLGLADYQKFFFSANGTCPGLAWPCVQNSVIAACAYDSITDKHYCCGGAHQATCRTLALTAWEPMVAPLLRNSDVLLETPTGAV